MLNLIKRKIFVFMNKENLIYGQLFGYARKQSAVKIMNEKLYPRYLQQHALSNISPESHFIGNTNCKCS